MTIFVRSQKRNFEHARAPENKDKNRYRNVITCEYSMLNLVSLCIPHNYCFVGDESRVELASRDGVAGSDYINASYIDVSNLQALHIGSNFRSKIFFESSYSESSLFGYLKSRLMTCDLNFFVEPQIIQN